MGAELIDEGWVQVLARASLGGLLIMAGAANKRLVHMKSDYVTFELVRLEFNNSVALVRDITKAFEPFVDDSDGDRELVSDALATI